MPVPSGRGPLFSIALVGLLGLVAISTNAQAPPARGDLAPKFSLKALDGSQVSLSEQLEQGPVVLVVLRGFPGYQCPICSKQVAELIGKASDLQAASARVLLVYPGPAEALEARATEFIGTKALPDGFELLLDPDYSFTKNYNLRWNADGETAYPSTFVIARDGRVAFAKISKTHGGRASTAEILKALPR